MAASRPVAVVVDEDGFAWVADGINRRVQRFSAALRRCLSSL